MGKQKEFVGTVISDKMNKTIIVRIATLAKHPKYSKTIKRYNKFKAHCEKNDAKVGDRVQIIETRPLSKDKHFRVSKIIQKAKAAHIQIKEEVI